MSKFITVCVLLAMTACGHIRYIASNDSAAELGEDFARVERVMDLAVESGAMTEEEAANWILFREKFRAIYVISADLYKAGVITDDAALMESAFDTISLLIPDLYKYANRCGIKLDSVK